MTPAPSAPPRPMRLPADVIVLPHLAFVVFVVAGGLLALRWPRVAWLHLPAVAWGAAVELMGWICPLTPIENRWREAAGAASYEGDFVGRYLLPLLYPEDLTPEIQMLLGVGVIAVNAAIYAWVLYRRFRL